MSKSGVSLTSSDFVHLHNHTEYSLLDGLTKVPSLIEEVKKLGMEAVAVTDHGTLSGSVEFYKTANDSYVKPIIGMEAYVAPRKYDQKDPSKDRQYFHLTMLAMNDTGYKNLMRLSSIANLEGYYYRPRVDKDLIKRHSEGVIVLSGCIQGEVSDALRQGQNRQAEQVANWFKDVFGDRYYLEVHDHGHSDHPRVWEEQKKVNEGLLKLSKKLNIHAVVTCDAHYLKREDQEAHEVLLCIQTGAFLDEKDRMSLSEFELHVADPKEIINRWGTSHPELITKTREIADRCNIKIDLGNILIPQFPVPKGKTEKTLLSEQVWQGLAWRYGGRSRESTEKLKINDIKKNLSKEIRERADYELAVVEAMGFNGYFLIVADFINWGKERGIVFGPGRGSAASSIMAYALRITEIDPMLYELLFERFLNPDRISMPDMDIDIQDNRRDEVINYCIEKYGREKVANIVTFGRMAARNSVRDVARVLRVPYAEADRLAKMIPPPVQGRHTPLHKHLKEVPELANQYRENNDAKRVFDLAMKLEGTIRSHGVHAAGVVIAPSEIIEFTPLELAQKGVVATQYSMNPIGDLGLLKIDFLGLSNLTTIKNTLRIVKKVYGESQDIDEIPLDDKRTFELLQRGDTTGVFQLESSGMKRYLKQLKPTVFDDIIAMVALYRPGPMQWIDDFIARKHGMRKIEYIHPIMKSTLEPTYGIIVYQEQVMQISKDLCGFSGGQADTLRSGIGKKNPAVLAKLKSEFIEGAVKTSKANKKEMEKFWGQLEDFAAYCFNKVHSACYGLIAYQTAYLKANFPDAFMAALMTSDYDNTDRLAIEINECKRMGIKVLSPDINQSFHEFAVIPNKNKIRFGLDAIKNVGHGAAEEIIRARESIGGQFNSLEEYCKAVSPQIVNRKALESLIKSGGFDSFGSRSSLLNSVDSILSYSSRLHKQVLSGQVDLFGELSQDESLSKIVPEDMDEYPENQLLSWERELLGLYLSRHPLEDFEEFLKKNTSPIGEIDQSSVGSDHIVGGSISAIRTINTKNGAQMAFVRLGDLTSEIELIVFPKVYKQTEALWQRDKVIIARGRLSTSDQSKSGDTFKLLLDDAQEVTIDDIKKSSFSINALRKKPLRVDNGPSSKRLYIRLEDSQNQSLLVSLKEKLDGYSGSTEVVLVTGPSENKQIIKLPQMIEVNESSLRDLASTFGAMNIVVR